MGNYFGTDGIRGIAGKFLNAELAFKLGQSLKAVLNTEKLVIGQDTRLSGDMLASSVAAGAMSAGINVERVGVVSTPMLAYYAKQENVDAVMITASHNPYHDNGLKLFKRGEKILEKEEIMIETHIDAPLKTETNAIGTESFSNCVDETYQGMYHAMDLEHVNMSVGLDCANGATYQIAKAIIGPLVDECKVIHNMPDGLNINLDCGSTHLEAIQAHVIEHKLDLGISFDGDGDRALVVDHQGKIIDGDLIIYALAKYFKTTNELTKNTVVLTKMSNPGIVKALKELGIKTVRTDVGDKYVSQEMRRGGYILGGENSGHIIMNTFMHTGDGILVAVMLLQMLQKLRIPLSKVIEAVDMYPQKMVNVKAVDKAVLEDKKVKAVIKEAEKTLGSDALLLVRASGTEPLIRVTISHRDEALLDRVMDLIVESIKKGGETI